MIYYNINVNGAWEYDKFALNYYNLFNEIQWRLERIKPLLEEKTISNKAIYSEESSKLYTQLKYKE